MTDIILIAVLLTITGGAVCYLYKAKKRGEHCVGCPHSKICTVAKSGKGCASVNKKK